MFSFLCFLPFISSCCEHVQHSNSTLTLVIIISFVSNLHTNNLLWYILWLVFIIISKVIICCHVATRICFVNLIFSSWLWWQKLLVLCNEFENENMRMITNFMEDMFGSWVSDNILLSKTTMNVIELEIFWLSYNFELLMTKEVNDQVKYKNIAWYSNFLMMQHENQRWIEHFWMTKKVV